MLSHCSLPRWVLVVIGGDVGCGAKVGERLEKC